MVSQRPDPLRSLVALALLHATLVFALTYSLSRYAVPLRPLLAWSLCMSHWSD